MIQDTIFFRNPLATTIAIGKYLDLNRGWINHVHVQTHKRTYRIDWHSKGSSANPKRPPFTITFTDTQGQEQVIPMPETKGMGSRIMQLEQEYP